MDPHEPPDNERTQVDLEPLFPLDEEWDEEETTEVGLACTLSELFS